MFDISDLGKLLQIKAAQRPIQNEPHQFQNLALTLQESEF
jgi:hypothetical protein